MQLAEAIAINLDHGRRCVELVERMGPAWWSQKCEQNNALYELLLTHIPAGARRATLELGANTGGAFELIESLGFGPIIGMELLEQQVRRARTEGRDVILGPMERMPLPDEAFDCVLSRHVLEHTYAPEATISEVWRVLRSGGYTAHALPATTFTVNEPAHVADPHWSAWWPLFRAAGFELVDARYVRTLAYQEGGRAMRRAVEPELHMVWRKPGASDERH